MTGFFRRIAIMRKLLTCVSAVLLVGSATARESGIEFEIKPKVCVLAAGDTRCTTEVDAHWRSAQPESLCLVIVERPDVMRCWEQFIAGSYSITLQFSTDLTVELTDHDSRRVLASQALRVIKAALYYRHKRRQPWNIFE